MHLRVFAVSNLLYSAVCGTKVLLGYLVGNNTNTAKVTVHDNAQETMAGHLENRNRG